MRLARLVDRGDRTNAGSLVQRLMSQEIFQRAALEAARGFDSRASALATATGFRDRHQQHRRRQKSPVVLREI